MSLIDEMANLRTAINQTKEGTTTAVRQITRDTKKIRQRAQELVRQFASTQKATAQKIKEDLERSTKELRSKVKKIRGENLKEQKERQRELIGARAAFWQSSAQLMEKKSKTSA